MRKLKGTLAAALTFLAVFCAVSCGEETSGKKAEAQNPTPDKVIETFYTAWEKSDIDAIASLVCEPMWEVTAQSDEKSVEGLKDEFKTLYKESLGSDIYYKIVETKEYKKNSDEFKETQKAIKEQYKIDIEGYAAIKVAVTYDNGEPVVETMEVIKYKDSWYAKDLLSN